MTKIITLLLSGFILVQSFNLDLTDIIQLDELIEHAQFHQKKYGDSFFVFISKHYGELKKEHSQKHKEEKEEHEQLPFNHQSCAHSLMAFVLNPIIASLPKIIPETNIDSNFFYKESYSFLNKSDIFQPPRYV